MRNLLIYILKFILVILLIIGTYLPIFIDGFGFLIVSVIPILLLYRELDKIHDKYFLVKFLEELKNKKKE